MSSDRSLKPQSNSRSRVFSGSLLSPKFSIRLGCWNIRSLGNPTRQNSRLREVLRTMKEKSLEVLALSEVRWPGHGVSRLEDTTIVYSGMAKEGSHNRRRGVAVLLSKRASFAWEAANSVFVPVSDRILRIRLKSHTGFMSIIAVYAPTNEPGNEADTEAFYHSLQSVVSQVPPQDMMLLVGDFNARVGNDTEAWNGTLGRFGPEEQNANGLKLLDFCTLNGLALTNTFFQHRPCHQYTWFHPAQSSYQGHLLDYVIVNRKFRSSILDTRVYRKTHLQSDHRLVVSKIRLKLKAKRRIGQKLLKYQLNPRLLEAEQIAAFRKVLNDELNTNPVGEVEPDWSTFKMSLHKAQSSLPTVPLAVEKDWVTEEVRVMSKKKSEAWMSWAKSPGNCELKEAYQVLKVQSRKCADKAREEWWEAKAVEAEELHEAAVRKGHGGSLVKDLKLLKDKQKLNACTSLLSSEGTLLSSTNDKIKRWHDYFALLNSVSVRIVESVAEAVLESTSESQQLGVNDGDLESLTQAPSEEEIRSALSMMKTGRAPGADGIPAELLKLGGDTVVQWLSSLASVVWEQEKVPEDWTKQLTIPLHKKGSYQDCDNYRGIALLSVPGKVFCRVIQSRMADRVNRVLRDNQCGFRKGRGCVDHIFSLRILAEKSREFNTPLYLSFVDLRKAYDSVCRDALWSVLKKYHFPDKLIRILQALHHDTKGAVRAYGRLSEEFPISTGVRQGDVLAPVLFNLFFDAIVAATLKHHPEAGLKVLYNIGDPLVGSRKKMRHEVVIKDLEYADDMVLVSDSMGLLEEILRTLHSTCSGMGLSINTKKTKILAMCPSSSQTGSQPRPVLLSPDSCPVEVVDHFEYLGSTVAQDCTLDREVNMRISKASYTFRSLCKVLWCQRRLKILTKMRLFKSVVLSTLLYGSETWVPLANHIARLQGFITGCLRVILGVSRWDNMRNTDLRSKAGVDRVEVMILRRRLRWLGHLERMEDSRLPKCLLVSRPTVGKRSVGGQKRRWNDAVMEDLKKCDLLADWREVARERVAWRGVVKLSADTLNQQLEISEKERKDQRKNRREGEHPVSAPFVCGEHGCPFVSTTKAGITNHKRQKHGAMAQSQKLCSLCNKSFHPQGFFMHTKYCQAKIT